LTRTPCLFAVWGIGDEDEEECNMRNEMLLMMGNPTGDMMEILEIHRKTERAR
jgi:hypothetical protein